LNLLENVATWSLWADGGEAPGIGGLLSNIPLILIIVLLFYFILLQPERKRRRQHQEMLGGLKKNDRILTASGIYGTVVNVHQDAGDVTIKVDENSNAKIRITRGSIGQVILDSDTKDS